MVIFITGKQVKLKLIKKAKPQTAVVSEATMLKNNGWQFRCNLPRDKLGANRWYLNLSRECLVRIGKLYNPSRQEKNKKANVSVWTKPKPNCDQ